MDKKVIVLILIISVISIFVITIVVPALLYTQSDDLLTITYVCTIGVKPTAFSAFRGFDNGTHAIDMDSCTWIKNPEPSIDYTEFMEIDKMSCVDLEKRYSTGKPYLSQENKIFAQEKISNCNSLKDLGIP